jgi:hypothetical protein
MILIKTRTGSRVCLDACVQLTLLNSIGPKLDLLTEDVRKQKSH